MKPANRQAILKWGTITHIGPTTHYFRQTRQNNVQRKQNHKHTKQSRDTWDKQNYSIFKRVFS